MGLFRRLIDVIVLGSDHPVRRLIGYYLILGLIVVALAYFFPTVDRILGGAEPQTLVRLPQVLEDGLGAAASGAVEPGDVPPRLELALTTLIIVLGTLALVLPVSWVYMSARAVKGHNQMVAQTLIFLPLVVAGIVLVVQNSLALAFSLAGVVAAVRFRTSFRDVRDVVFIFLVIAVGFAAGVQSFVVAAVISISFNFVMILTWRYDFGRNALEPSAATKWGEPLRQLTEPGGTSVPDRDLVMALDPEEATALAERFERVRRILGADGKKPRVNAILTVTTNQLSEAQRRIGPVLEEVAGRWQLDEVITNQDKPSQLYYLVRLRKKTSRDDLLTAVRARAGEFIKTADVELADARVKEEEKEQSKE
ncbi:MAG TPA: DUF4956 domain-containing protein [Gemmatimonadales bacterium]|nr:DUF4956 domain-containing protein [Gemmatimonadales bacterium]